MKETIRFVISILFLTFLPGAIYYAIKNFHQKQDDRRELIQSARRAEANEEVQDLQSEA